MWYRCGHLVLDPLVQQLEEPVPIEGRRGEFTALVPRISHSHPPWVVTSEQARDPGLVHAEARRLLMAALERIPPQLEAPQEARESPETARGEPEGAGPDSATGGAQGGARRPWWRRMFGG